ncbi:repetin [Anabrus simplex]|uniref:repetin n=1 Tax=Anabrus simplex TaxID=316456 RepID=UPI0035A32CBD
MKGYCYFVAFWLLLLGDQLVSARKLKSLGRFSLQGNSMGVMDLGYEADVVRISHQGQKRSVATSGVKASKTSQDHAQVHDHYSHKKGSEGKEKQAVTHAEAGGKKHSSEQGASHQAGHHEGHKGQVGHKYNGGDHQKKTGFTKGYHGKYHKDEYHKLDKHWKNANENGQYQKYGEQGEHFYKQGSKHNKGGKSTKSSQASQHGKKGKHAKGHQSSDQKGHQGHKGHQKQSAHSSHSAKKGGQSGGKQHSYKVHE